MTRKGLGRTTQVVYRHVKSQGVTGKAYMSPDEPPAPPEAEVIRLARKAMDMTAERAAEASRAHNGKGISAAYWRDVERGHGGRRGQRVPVRASDRALAAMARVVGVGPRQLTEAGREDAARVLGEMLRRDAPPANPVPVLPPDRTWEPAILGPGRAAQMAPHIAEIQARLSVWAAGLAERGEAVPGLIPDGVTVFPDRPLDAERWDLLVKAGILGEPHTLWQLIEDVADLRVRDEERRQGQQGRGGVAAGLIRRLRAIPPDVTIGSRSAAF
jgi:hypothetical protein